MHITSKYPKIKFLNYAVYISQEHLLESIINDVVEDCDEFFPYNRQTGFTFKSNSLLLSGCTCSNFREVKTI
jgi:hypothetical protein